MLAFKDHDSDNPASHLHGFPTTPVETMRTWLMSHRTPSFVELSSGSFQSIMNAPQEPLVLIAAVTEKVRDQAMVALKTLATEWKLKTGGSGELNGKQVIFTYMDAEKWEKWLKSMYGIKKHHDDDLADVKVVIADHKVGDCLLLRDLPLNKCVSKKLIYYDEDTSGHKIKLTSQEKLFTTLEKVTAEQLHYKHSQNRVERLAAVSHPSVLDNC